MAVRSWSEGISEELRANVPRRRSQEHLSLFLGRGAASHRVDYEIEDALVGHQDLRESCRCVAGLRRMARARRTGPTCTSADNLGRVAEDARVKLYLLEPKSLSQILPFFQNPTSVFNEGPFEIETSDGRGFFPLRSGLGLPGRGGSVATGELAESFDDNKPPSRTAILDRLSQRCGIASSSCAATLGNLRQIGNTNS
jgi:glutamate dehydrogenase